VRARSRAEAGGDRRRKGGGFAGGEQEPVVAPWQGGKEGTDCCVKER
jgi:hypothetical protein